MTFSEIRSLFEQVKANNPEAADLTFEEFARLGALSTGDPEMARIGSSRPWQNFVRLANQKLNEGIAAVTPDETLGNVVGDLAESVGVSREVGENVGKSLPRQIVNVGALAIPGIGPALSFGLSAADAYDSTGSMWQTAIAGSTPFIVGKAMSVGGNAALQAAAKSPTLQKLGVTGGKEVIRDITGEAAKYLPVGSKTVDTVIDQLPDKLVRFAGAELAGQATGLGLDVAAQGPDAVLNKDYLFANLVGNLVFAPLNINDFVGTKTIESGRVILPPEAEPIRTPAEQRVFEFESLLETLSPAERQKARVNAGLDIAAQVLGERRLTQINKEYDDEVSREKVLLEDDWERLKKAEPAIAKMESEEALKDPSKLNVIAPEAKARIEQFQEKMKELKALRDTRLKTLKLMENPNELLGISYDELKLTEGLLKKPIDQRVFEDYKKALSGKVSERGQQVVYAVHKLMAGQREELMNGPYKEVASEVEKVLQGKKTKFAEDRSFVSMALWATGKRPMSDKEVKKKVEKKVKEGKPAQEAVKEVNQSELALVPVAQKQQVVPKTQEQSQLSKEKAKEAGQKAQDAFLAKITPKKRGRPEGLAKATLDRIKKSEERIEKGLASESPEQVDFYTKLRMLISEIDEGDDGVYAKIMAEVDRQVGMTFDKGLPKDRALEMLKQKFSEIKIAYEKDQISKGKKADQDNGSAETLEANETKGSDGLEELEALREALGLPEIGLDKEELGKINPAIINTWALQLLERGITKEIVMTLDKYSEFPVVRALKKSLIDLNLPKVFSNGKLDPRYQEFAKFFHELMRKVAPNITYKGSLTELENMGVASQNRVWLIYKRWVKDGKPPVESIVGTQAVKLALDFARAKKDNDLAVSPVHEMMSFDEWSEALLAREGFDPDEAAQLKEHFENVVRMFYAPEVRYGRLEEARNEGLSFARAQAGGEFMFNMAEFRDGKLIRPNKGAVAVKKDGTLSLQEFKVAGGQSGPLTEAEIEFYKTLAPEAFVGDRVNVKQLWDVLNSPEERLRVDVYGQAEQVSKEKQRLDWLTHEWYDNLNDRQRAAVDVQRLAQQVNKTVAEYLSSEEAAQRMLAPAQSLDQNKMAEYLQLSAVVQSQGIQATPIYKTISPFDPARYPIVRIDVSLPKQKISFEAWRKFHGSEDEAHDRIRYKREQNITAVRSPLWKQDDIHENLPDTLGWAMVQFVPDPKTGETVAFVAEQQSRWAQNRHANTPISATRNPDETWKVKFRNPKASAIDIIAKNEKEAIAKVQEGFTNFVFPPHPLLESHAALVLKAVIREAQKRGVKKIVISDGASSVMTQKQDVAGSNFTPRLVKAGLQVGDYVYGKRDEKGRLFNWLSSGKSPEAIDNNFNQDGYSIFQLTEKDFAPQVEGMRLHYDTTLPSLMKKLTGDSGEAWDGGIHKNAISESDSNIVGSPVFRNPDGTPKSSVTGRVFDISNPSERVNTLFARPDISAPYAAAATRTRDIFFSPSPLKGKDLILQQASLLAHEHSHILFAKARSGVFGPEAQQKVQEFEAWVKQISPHEAETFADVVSDVWLGKEWKELPGVGDVIKNIRNEDGSVDSEELMANVFGAFAAGMSKTRNPTKFYTMLPRVVRDMFDWIVRNLQGLVNAAKVYYEFGGDGKKVAQVRKVKEVFDEVRRGARNAERNLADLAELANLRGEDVLDRVDLMYAKGKYGSSGKGKWREQLSYMFDNTIMRMGSLAATYDGLQEPFVAMKDFSALNADLTAQVFASLGMGKYSHTGLGVEKDGAWMRIRMSPELHKMASHINVEMQMLNKNFVTRGSDGSLQFDTSEMSPELRGKFAAFSQEAQQAVAEYFVRRAEKANPIVHGVIVGKQWESETNKLHELLFESKYEEFSQQYEKSKLWAERLMKLARNGDAPGMGIELLKIQDPVARAQIEEYVNAIAHKIKSLQLEYQKNPNFGSLRRFQPIKVKWIKDGKVKNMQATTAEEAEKMEAELRADGWTPQSVRITDFRPRGDDVLDSDTKLRIKDMEERVKIALKKMAVPEELKAEVDKEIDFIGMIERTENAQSVFSTKANRRFAEGVEDLLVLEQDMLWMSKAIYAANRNALDTKIRVTLKNPKLDDYLDAKRTFAQGYENFKTQNHDWLRKLSKANAAYFIGFNIPGHIAELMQPVMTHMAEMRYVGIKTGDALGIMLKASKDLAGFYKRNMKKFIKGEEVHIWDSWSDPEEKDMLFRLKHVINMNPLNYAYEDAGFEQQKLIEVAETGKKQTLLNLIASPATAYANWGLKFYSLFTRHNAIMGLLNGYRSFRKLGFSHEEAIEKTKLFETVVNKSGGKADRQVFPFKNNAVLGHLFYGLQGYTTGWISQLATYYRHGYKSDNYIGFRNNPEAIKRAREAFKTMLYAQFAAAGLMGMPFVGALITLFEEFSGEDVRGKMYEALDEVIKDPLLAQAASHGLSTSIAERLGIPADLHGRFAIGGLLGFNPYDGFSASSLLGPTAGMINSMWNLGKTYAQEHDLRVAFASGGPTGLRSIAKALDKELPFRNENAITTALGFNTIESRKEKEFSRIAQKRNEKAARDIAHAARRVQESLAYGSSVAQRKLRTEALRLIESPDQLEETIRAIGNKVKLFEEQRLLPKDAREVATPRTAAGLSNLAKAMNLRLPPSQEVEREMLKQHVMKQMGLSPASRLREAMMADRLAEMDPWSLR